MTPKDQTRLSDFTFTLHFHALEKEMATHSSILSWKIPWTEEPGGLQSMGVTESDTTEATKPPHVYMYSRKKLPLMSYPDLML